MSGTAINSPADMKGKKIRIIEKSHFMSNHPKRLVANLFPMAGQRSIRGLQQGTSMAVEDQLSRYWVMQSCTEVPRTGATDHSFYWATIYIMNLDKIRPLSTSA